MKERVKRKEILADTYLCCSFFFLLTLCLGKVFHSKEIVENMDLSEIIKV